MQTNHSARTIQWSVVLVLTIVLLAFMNDIADLFGFRAQWDSYGEIISVATIVALAITLTLGWKKSP